MSEFMLLLKIKLVIHDNIAENDNSAVNSIFDEN
jgi:hypothetical protein